MLNIWPHLERTFFPRIQRAALETIQVNLGYRCNQSCLHCHVNAGPNRREAMSAENLQHVLDFIDRSPSLRCIDLTGGAPELNPNFRRLVSESRARGLHIIDRCNLTVLQEPDCQDLAGFFARHEVEVVASLPCYRKENVDRQRGKGTFSRSIEALRLLNRLGYGRPKSGLSLSLVFNPQGARLPPPQAQLEADYRTYLRERFGIEFSRLLALANMPIQRFGSTLLSNGDFEAYLTTLRGAHRDENLSGVMCRTMISVDWRGFVHDCDFNQQLGLGLGEEGERVHIESLGVASLSARSVKVAEHCWGCTAGQGSGCGGAIATRAGLAEVA